MNIMSGMIIEAYFVKSAENRLHRVALDLDPDADHDEAEADDRLGAILAAGIGPRGGGSGGSGGGGRRKSKRPSSKLSWSHTTSQEKRKSHSHFLPWMGGRTVENPARNHFQQQRAGTGAKVSTAHSVN